MGGINRFLDRHIELSRDKLGNLIDYAQRNIHHSPDITHRSFGRHRTECNNLRHMIDPVAFDDIVDDLAAALITKVNINIRHTDALRI